MTDTVEAIAALPGSARSRRRRTLVAALTVAVLSVVGVVVVRHSDATYGPLTAGSFGGEYSARNIVADARADTYRLNVSPAATAQIMESLSNSGSHSVTVTKVDTDQIVTNVKWSVWQFVNGGSVSGLDTPWRAFPAVIPAHGTIRLLVTVHHPSSCPRLAAVPGSLEGVYQGNHVVHWDSLLGSHQTYIQGGWDITVC